MIDSHQVERPSSWLSGPPGFRRSTVPIGTATSNDRPTVGPRKRAGATPTMVKGYAVDGQRAADDAGIAAESALPEALAEDDGRAVRAAAAAVVGGRQAARPSCGLDAQRLEEAAADQERRYRIDFASAREVEAHLRSTPALPQRTCRRARRASSQIGLVQLSPVDRRPARCGARPAATGAAPRRRARRSRCWRRCPRPIDSIAAMSRPGLLRRLRAP